jgi:cyclin A
LGDEGGQKEGPKPGGSEMEDELKFPLDAEDKDVEMLPDAKIMDRLSDEEVGAVISYGLGPLDEYVADIYAELKRNELKYRPRPDYMESVQKDINQTMRGILVDWLVEVAEEYKLTSQTLFLTVSYVDRLLSVVSVHRTKLQLIGITCMLLASKYEEIYPPSVDDFVYIADNTYTRSEVLRMETVLLNTLKFSLTSATTWEFARRFCKLGNLDAKTTCFANYLTELFLQEPTHLLQLPSKVAAGACCLALYSTNQPAWTPALQQATGYAFDDLKEVIGQLHATHLRMHKGKISLKAVRNKYTEEKRFRVAQIAALEELELAGVSKPA